MEIEFTDEGIIFNKEINRLDEFVLDFVRILEKQGIRYCLISGYVAILFGRSRSTEDVDIFIEPIEEDRFCKLWKALKEQFDCIITSDPKDALSNYLKEGLAIRFAYPGKVIPNMEMKFPSNKIDTWTLEKRKQLFINEDHLWISPMEIQIPFKLWLGSDKDIEDAVHLHSIFRDHLEKEPLDQLLEELNQADKYRRMFHAK